MTIKQMYKQMYSLIRDADNEQWSMTNIGWFVSKQDIPAYVIKNALISFYNRSIKSDYDWSRDIRFSQMRQKHKPETMIHDIPF